MLLLTISYDPYLSVLWTLTFDLGQILFHFAFFVILGDILTSPQLAEITFFNIFFSKLYHRVPKEYTYGETPNHNVYPKNSLRIPLKVVDALKFHSVQLKSL